MLRKVRQSWSLNWPVSAVTMWIGAFAVPRAPSFVTWPAPINAGMLAKLSSPLVEEATPIQKIHKGHVKQRIGIINLMNATQASLEEFEL